MSLDNSDQSPKRWHLLRKVVLLFLLVAALTLGLVLLFRQNSSFPLLLFNILADASLGLLIGLGTRMVLRGRAWLIQALASAAVCIVGLALLGYFTNWESGIGPFRAGLVRVHWLDWANVALRLPLQFQRSTMDLLDLAHVVIAVDTGWIALRAWKRSPRIVGQRATPSSTPRVKNRPKPPKGRQVSPPAAVPSTPVQKIRVPTTSSISTSSASIGSSVRRKRVGRPLISRPAAAPLRPARAKSTKRWNPLRHNKPAVQLAVYEEHRCPYCLEVVNRNDPRGVVECQVCHTLHHKDCWDITGSCQVPHLNT